MLPEPNNSDRLKILPNSLVVFVDDTGHEELKQKDHPVYGLGGCAVMAENLDTLLVQPWRNVRQNILGSPDTPLHASEFAQIAKPEQIATIVKFFRSQPFCRLGAIMTNDTTTADGMNGIKTIANTLMNRIVDIAKWTPFTKIYIIFESSKRANPLIERAFQGYNFYEDDKPIPIECFFMPKSEHHPALEVADFIVHAVGRQARHAVKGNDFLPDFKAVFHEVDEKLVSYMKVDKVEANAV
jgi:hypothetical protein